MSRHMLIGDIHLSAKSPSSRTETYPYDILAKLEWIVNYSNENDLETIICLGDVFHLKQASKTPHWLVIATAKVFEKFNGRVLIVPGNHDISQDRLDSLSSQPLGALAIAGNIELLDGYDEETGIVGIPYYDDFSVFHKALAFASDDEPKLFATHASIFPPDVHPPYPHMNADQMNTWNIPLAYGHIHDPHGFYEVNGAWFCNNGAISRGSLHEETVNRKLKVTVFDSSVENDCPFASVDIPYKPAGEVFRLVEHAEKQDKEKKLDNFLSNLESVSLTSLSLEEVIHQANQNEGLSTEAKKELADIMESVLG